MYILYVDESGDPGKSEYSSLHYSLSALVINVNNWHKYLDRLKKYRKYLKDNFQLNQRTEIHSAELIRISKIKEYRFIKKSKRIALLKDCSQNIPKIFSDAKVINIYLLKKDFQERDIQEQAWKRLIQRFDNFMSKQSGNEKGIIISDAGIGNKVTTILRKMRVYNPISSSGSSYNPVIENIIEDVFTHDSKDSYFIQCADIISYCLYISEQPKGALKKYGAQYYFKNFEPILLKKASKYDDNGIVRK